MSETPYLTTTEVAAIIRTTPDYVAKLCKSGALRAQKVGGWRIHRDALEAFMAGSKPAPTRVRRRRAA